MVTKNYKLSDFVECGQTFEKTRTNNVPQEAESVAAITALASELLEPVTKKFGKVQLTYGLATRNLLAHITRRIAPRYDQHAAFELGAKGKRICLRDGFAVDFSVNNMSSLTVAKYIVENLPFDRLYYYGGDRPIHVSYGPEHSKKICVMRYRRDLDRWFPTNSTIAKFLNCCE
jgi:hypothetical protein